jgi:hypothetical protein
MHPGCIATDSFRSTFTECLFIKCLFYSRVSADYDDCNKIGPWHYEDLAGDQG